ncbi:MAG: uroporphyrinogen-III C-methyltransferase [Deltaproteobacteria bacterium]|nr:uroporphyrinogen-III C-methyltransferase [Deltaproteobacteria bacterium]
MAKGLSPLRGKVYLVGAGPGDAGLITVKGAELLKEADCVVYDFLANSRLLDYVKKGAETIYVGKKGLSPLRGCAANAISQDEINAIIIKKAQSGKVVVRLKGGDPFIFGRGGEEAEELVEAGIPFEVVPGVTSAIAAPAYAGIPLTHRELASSVTFITGHEDPLKERSSVAWDRLSTGKGTLVFLMGWKNLPFIVSKLLENGWPGDTPVALVRWGTLTKQRCVAGTLAGIVSLSEKSGMKPPVVTIVGAVVGLRQRLNWFETKPLFGKRVLVTRALEQAGEFTKLLEKEGAEPVIFPTIKTGPPPDWKKLDSAIKRLSVYDWAVFTSVNGVKYFSERLYKLGHDLRELKGVKICAIGPRTEEAVRSLGVRVDLTPKEYRAEAVISGLGRRGIRGKRFLLARALEAREILPVEIKRLGGRIDVAPAYKTVRPNKEAGEIKKLLMDRGIDVVTFTSSSTVTNFAAMFKKKELAAALKGVTIACIGPVTADTARAHGLNVDIMPEEYTIPALTGAMAEYFRGMTPFRGGQ